MDMRFALAIAMAYLVSIALGNLVMRRRKAFRLKYFTAIHNAVLFSLSLYMCLETLRQVGAILDVTWKLISSYCY